MHVRKAHDQLLKLVNSAPASLTTLTTASMLIAGMEASNTDHPDIGERPNETVREKLHSARGWFEILCGVGEDGNWPESDVRHFIRCDLDIVGDNIAPDGLEFRYWLSAGPHN